jgi:hypothetical protein
MNLQEVDGGMDWAILALGRYMGRSVNVEMNIRAS